MSTIAQVVVRMCRDVLERNMVEYIPIIASQTRADPFAIVKDELKGGVLCCCYCNNACACCFLTYINRNSYALNCIGWDYEICLSLQDVKSVVADYGFFCGEWIPDAKDKMDAKAEKEYLIREVLPLFAIGAADPMYQAMANAIGCLRVSTNEYDIVGFYAGELAARARDKDARFLLVCAWSLASGSPFHRDVFPLDLLKEIRALIVTTYRDPLPRPALERVRNAPRLRHGWSE